MERRVGDSIRWLPQVIALRLLNLARCPIIGSEATGLQEFCAGSCHWRLICCSQRLKPLRVAPQNMVDSPLQDLRICYLAWETQKSLRDFDEKLKCEAFSLKSAGCDAANGA